MLVQLREAQMPAEERRSFSMQAVHRMQAAGGLALVNSDDTLARQAGADGIHLTSIQLMQLERRPDFSWVGASCHNEHEVRRAEELELDFVAVGPLAPTPTHPESKVLGWDGFSALAQGVTLPVYALGGLAASDLPEARRRGAHGIAMIRGAWSGVN